MAVASVRQELLIPSAESVASEYNQFSGILQSEKESTPRQVDFMYQTFFDNVRYDLSQQAYYDNQRHEIVSRPTWSLQIWETANIKDFCMHTIGRDDIINMLSTLNVSTDDIYALFE